MSSCAATSTPRAGSTHRIVELNAFGTAAKPLPQQTYGPTDVIHVTVLKPVRPQARRVRGRQGLVTERRRGCKGSLVGFSARERPPAARIGCSLEQDLEFIGCRVDPKHNGHRPVLCLGVTAGRGL